MMQYSGPKGTGVHQSLGKEGGGMGGEFCWLSPQIKAANVYQWLGWESKSVLFSQEI